MVECMRPYRDEHGPSEMRSRVEAGCVVGAEASLLSDLVRRRPIFIADADGAARRMVGACLTSLNLTNPTVELTDGDQLMHTLQDSFELGPSYLPALVVLDLKLIGFSGLDVLRWLRDTVGVGRIPVVVLTAEEGAADVTEAYRLGARSYLVKPTGFEVLSSVVRDLDQPWALT